MPSSDDFQYDPKTHTVRVSVRDLHRLLLEFRHLLENADQSACQEWGHMVDYDQSFERLADAVDAGSRLGAKYPGSDEPDLRTRCKDHPVYSWPASPETYGGPVKVEAFRVSGGYGVHYMTMGDGTPGSFPTALCGFWCTPEEARRTKAAPDCSVCVREAEIMGPVARARDGQAAS